MNNRLTVTAKSANACIQRAIEQGATDIHFCPYEDEVMVYHRIGGERMYEDRLALTDYVPLLAYFKFSANMDIGEMRKPQNGHYVHQEKEFTYALRLSTLPLTETESLAIRILPQKSLPALQELFLFPQQATLMSQWMRTASGMIVFTGPTGSGKTTTMYALLLSLLQEHSFQTITLEDPIEQPLKDILQVQVNEKSGMDYHTGLKAALRHDPDIIMIGEIRDRETAQFAFHAAHTGHLVITTLHAKNAFGTLYRLREMGISMTDLQQTLTAVASLQLLPTLTSKSKRAAIVELLNGALLERAIEGNAPTEGEGFQPFARLRRKAYALGYIKTP
nr:competence type IV pilus ATPase ComGA [Pontibacillus halophilus]